MLVNLNKARKRKAKETAVATAAENRVRFGRSKTEKAAEAAAAGKAAKDVEAHKRER